MDAPLSAHIEAAVARERRRIAHDLHDGIGQMLATIRLRADHAGILLADGHADAGAQLLDLIKTTVSGTVAELRRICWCFCPAEMTGGDVAGAIVRLVDTFGDCHPTFHVTSRIKVNSRQIPDAVVVAAYRILQEALHNVSKHSGANRVRVEVFGSRHSMSVRVKDDGRGFDTARGIRAAMATNSSYGLAGMYERAALTGGNISIYSGPTDGTILSAKWPLATAAGRGATKS